MISNDEGKTSETNFVLRDGGPDEDPGYPASVELGDGSILIVYYQRLLVDKNFDIMDKMENLSTGINFRLFLQDCFLILIAGTHLGS